HNSLFLAAPQQATGNLLFDQRMECRRSPGGWLLRNVPEQGTDHCRTPHGPAQRVGGFLVELLEEDFGFAGEPMGAEHGEGFCRLFWRACHIPRSYLIDGWHATGSTLQEEQFVTRANDAGGVSTQS